MNRVIETETLANLRQAVPFFMVKDIDASVRFYVDGLGFEMTHEWIDEGRLRWCWLQRGGAAVMLQEYRREGPHATPANGSPTKVGEGVSIYFICEDAIRFYREVVARGVRAPRKPFVGNGMWVTPLEDPDGYRLFFESVTDAPEECEMSEP
jgi:catechol 2,3-dioxygenase-like lactoylglutathione lyase family enzyme